MKFLWIVALFIVVLVGGAYVGHWLLDEGYVRLNYPSRDEYPVQGIDVSHHQGDIDWPKVEAEGIQFAFIKATEGGDFTDKRFATNWAAAAKTGILRGAYHFMTFCRPVADQLQHIKATIPVEKGTFPPVLDLEFGGNCSRVPSVDAMTADLELLVSGIEAHYGKRPIFYITDEFVAAYHSASFPSAVVWIRDVFSRPDLPKELNWTFWQFANRGRLEGIGDVVDLNVFKGTMSDLRALLQ